MDIGKSIVKTALAILMIAALVRCANPVSPTGGPPDEDPPVVVKSDPENYSVFFDQDRISITFNEFVELKQPNQQVLTSPPLKENPTYKIRGKSVLIELNEELQPNTTYTIFFGDAIVDLTAGNPFRDYLYAFSTGDHIDSLAIGGEVLNAFNLQPQEDVFVMLYPPENDTVPQDSLPMLVRPLYVAKTNAAGVFQLRNLRDEPYKIFALRDMNSNYLYDQPNEEIAFLDSLIRPETFEVPRQDSLIQQDSLITADTTLTDSVVVSQVFDHYYHLMMFQQIDSTQRLLAKEDFWPPKFRLIYKFPADDPHFEVINQDPEEGWYVSELNRRRDSLMVWVKNMNLDSLEIKVADGDSILDTTVVTFARHKDKEETSRRRNKSDEETPERITFNANTNGRAMDLGKPFKLIFNDPLINWDFTEVQFVAGEDTATGAPFVPSDSIHRIFTLDYPLEEETPYNFVFPDSTLFNIYGLTNDSVRLGIRTKKAADYGNLFLNVSRESGDYPYLVQLLDKKDNVIREKYITSDTILTFQFLDPGFYILKGIQDTWRNKKWDTGEYLKKRQPENVFYFPAEVQVRANWDIDESWALP